MAATNVMPPELDVLQPDASNIWLQVEMPREILQLSFWTKASA
jgi:hypothetical protein